MRSLLAASMLLLLAPVARGDGAPVEASQPADDSSYLTAYKALKPEELEKKKIDALPQQQMKRIEVKQRIRLASFGHKTTLVVPITEGQTKREFYVEYGASTNRPAQLFGPFPL